MIRTPYIRINLDLAELGPCEYSSSQTSCKQSASAKVHPKVTAGLATTTSCYDAFIYRDTKSTRPFPFLGRFQDYSIDGFYFDIPIVSGTPATARTEVECLENNTWLNDQ